MQKETIRLYIRKLGIEDMIKELYSEKEDIEDIIMDVENNNEHCILEHCTLENISLVETD